jgi:hypothetical protein
MFGAMIRCGVAEGSHAVIAQTNIPDFPLFPA